MVRRRQQQQNQGKNKRLPKQIEGEFHKPLAESAKRLVRVIQKLLSRREFYIIN
jgi:hypothetical protein